MLSYLQHMSPKWSIENENPTSKKSSNVALFSSVVVHIPFKLQEEKNIITTTTTGSDTENSTVVVS